MVFGVYRFLELINGKSYGNMCRLETQPHFEAYVTFLLMETVSGYMSALRLSPPVSAHLFLFYNVSLSWDWVLQQTHPVRLFLLFFLFLLFLLFLLVFLLFEDSILTADAGFYGGL